METTESLLPFDPPCSGGDLSLPVGVISCSLRFAGRQLGFHPSTACRSAGLFRGAMASRPAANWSMPSESVGPRVCRASVSCEKARAPPRTALPGSGVERVVR